MDAGTTRKTRQVNWSTISKEKRKKLEGASDTSGATSKLGKWGVVKNKISNASSSPRASRDDRGSISLEGAEPELCITLVSRGLNFRGLMRRLHTADENWMEQFLTHGGLSSIFNALEILCSKGFFSITDALRQLDCVNCIKAVMNNRFGLEFLIALPGEGFVKKLAQGKKPKTGQTLLYK